MLRNMRVRLSLAAVVATLPAGNLALAGRSGPAFTYQGQLKQNGAPANGPFDFRFSLTTTQFGVVLPPPQCRRGVTVVNGLFTTEVEFPPDTFVGPQFSLQVAVQPSGGNLDCVSNTLPDPFINLGPPQPILATPYAIHALSAANGHALNGADGSPTNALFVDNNGNVGIGTTNPSRQLEVASAGDAEIGVRSTDTNGRLWSLQSSRVSGGATDATFQVVDRTAGASRVTIDTTGDVGIGTTAPTAKLHVNGTVRAVGLTSFDPDGTLVFEVASNGILLLRDPLNQEDRVTLSGAGPLGGTLELKNTGGVVDTVTLTGGSSSGGDLVLRQGNGTTTVNLDAEGAGGGAVLFMDNSAGVTTARLDADDADAAVFVLTNAAGTNTVVLDGESDDTSAPDGGRVSVRNGAGRETVEIDADETGAAALRLSRASGGATIQMVASTSQIILSQGDGTTAIVLNGEEGSHPFLKGGHISVRNDMGTETVEIDGEAGSASDGSGSVVVKNTSGSGTISLVGEGGIVRCVDLIETSTRSMKNDIQPIADALARLVLLNGVEFTWDQCVGGRRDVGLIAEDVAEVLPELVRFEEDGVTATGMNYTHLTALIVEAVKELTQEKNEQLCELRAEKDAELAELRKRLAVLEEQVAHQNEAKKSGGER